MVLLSKMCDNHWLMSDERVGSAAKMADEIISKEV